MKKSVIVHENFVKKNLDKKIAEIFQEFVEKTVLIRKLVRILSF